jgi:hypothetical protein
MPKSRPMAQEDPKPTSTHVVESVAGNPMGRK